MRRIPGGSWFVYHGKRQLSRASTIESTNDSPSVGHALFTKPRQRSNMIDCAAETLHSIIVITIEIE